MSSSPKRGRGRRQRAYGRRVATYVPPTHLTPATVRARAIQHGLRTTLWLGDDLRGWVVAVSMYTGHYQHLLGGLAAMRRRYGPAWGPEDALGRIQHWAATWNWPVEIVPIGTGHKQPWML